MREPYPGGSVATNGGFWGERLRLAREFRGITQKELGAQVAASYTLISLCESGKKRNPAPDLVEACDFFLGFEPWFFYAPLRDAFREEECSFRHRRAAPEKLKAKIRAHATLIGMVIGRLRSVFKFPELNLPRLPASGPEEIEMAAERSRLHWKLGLDAPIRQIGRVLEHAGVVIVSHLVQSNRVDAFSRCGDTSVIFLNQAISSTSRWNFDIAHECGHLVMHQGTPTGSTETEAAADHFASAFLMPRTAFGREFRARAGTSFWKHIFGMKRRWQCSAAAVVRRAYGLGLIDAVAYRQSFKIMSARGWTRGEPDEAIFQRPELLEAALLGLGVKVDLTLDQLCQEMGFTPGTFKEITGVSVPEIKLKHTPVIPMRA